MNFTILYSSSWLFRSTLKTVVFLLALSVAVFSVSAGYGLLKVLLLALSSGTKIGIAEFSTHSGLTMVFFVVAGLGAYVAKKCFW
jgi:hypothetical protein